jgi:hypothetical protein
MLPKVVWFYQMSSVTAEPMPTDERMTIDERYKYLRLMRPRYIKADRRGRGRLLDEMEQVTQLHRESLIRRLKDDLK